MSEEARHRESSALEVHQESLEVEVDNDAEEGTILKFNFTGAAPFPQLIESLNLSTSSIVEGVDLEMTKELIQCLQELQDMSAAGNFPGRSRQAPAFDNLSVDVSLPQQPPGDSSSSGAYPHPGVHSTSTPVSNVFKHYSEPSGAPSLHLETQDRSHESMMYATFPKSNTSSWLNSCQEQMGRIVNPPNLVLSKPPPPPPISITDPPPGLKGSHKSKPLFATSTAPGKPTRGGQGKGRGQRNHWNRQLFEAVKTNSYDEAIHALENGADVNFTINVSQPDHLDNYQTCLHRAIISGGRRIILALLLSRQADANVRNCDFETPLHMVINQYENLSTAVPRLLICHGADVYAKDKYHRSPVSLVNDMKARLEQDGFRNSKGRLLCLAARLRIEQLVEEVTLQPTLAAVVHTEEIIDVVFLTRAGNIAAFSTATRLNIFDVAAQSVVMTKKLQQLDAATIMDRIASDVSNGTMVFSVLQPDPQIPTSFKCVLWVWNFERHRAESPAIIKALTFSNRVFQQSEIVMSQGCDECVCSKICIRCADSRVIFLQLDEGSTRSVTEHIMSCPGKSVAISSNGEWAAVNVGRLARPNEIPVIQVWVIRDLVNQAPYLAHVIQCDSGAFNRCLCITQSSGQGLVGTLTLDDPADGDGDLQLWLVRGEEGGSYQRIWSVPSQNIRFLHFCCSEPELLCAGQVDGVMVVYNLKTGTKHYCLDDVSVTSASMSWDGCVCISAFTSFLRVFRRNSGHYLHIDSLRE